MSISHERITPRSLPGKVISSVDGSELMAEVPPWGFGNAADVQMRHRRRGHTRQTGQDATRNLGQRNGSIEPAWRTAPWRHDRHGRGDRESPSVTAMSEVRRWRAALVPGGRG